MTIFSQTGELAVFGNNIADAAKAAENAVNQDCSLGRPLELSVCDDQSTPNGSLLCGRKASSSGVLALLGFSAGPGGSDKGSQVSGLPAVFTLDQTNWDHTSELSYPSWSAPLSSAGSIRTAEAFGAKSFAFVGVDVPPGRIGAQTAAAFAKTSGIEFESIFFPLDTTDYTSIAAQLVSNEPDGFVASLPGVQSFIRSLLSAGADLSAMKYIGAEGILTPEQATELGSEFAGYEVGSIVPAGESSNPGIAEMKEDYEAAGLEFSANIPPQGVQEWTSVQALVLALTPLVESGEIDSLTSDSLVEAVVDHGEYELPTVAPFDFTHAAKFENAEVAKIFADTRTFSTYTGTFETGAGEGTQLGGAFQDVNAKFDFEVE